MLSYQEAHRLFEYEPTSGVLTNRVNRRGRAKASGVVGSVETNSYLQAMVEGKVYAVHRIIWLLMTGAFPENEVDHINGIRTDNRWENLRSATRQQNTVNQKVRSDNKSGFKGVCWDKREKKWRASISFHGTQYHLGLFDSLSDAITARKGIERIAFGEFNRAA